MGRIGLFIGDLSTPPLVPLPHQCRLLFKRLNADQIFGLVLLPQSGKFQVKVLINERSGQIFIYGAVTALLSGILGIALGWMVAGRKGRW